MMMNGENPNAAGFGVKEVALMLVGVLLLLLSAFIEDYKILLVAAGCGLMTISAIVAANHEAEEGGNKG